tara:strand:+ start:2327 stop:2650 length:324 start_codon:yes stop_codon:yes gene_type:complete
MSILSPDKNLLAYKYYHTFGKALIPLTLFSYLNNKYNFNYKAIDVFTTINLGYHSYFSTSCIISDYIKNNKVAKVSRLTNLNLHIISTIGIFKYIKNNGIIENKFIN